MPRWHALWAMYSTQLLLCHNSRIPLSEPFGFDSMFVALTVWTMGPESLTSMVVVLSLRHQHEGDWLSNRHGLVISFEDSAGREYQVKEEYCR